MIDSTTRRYLHLRRLARRQEREYFDIRAHLTGKELPFLAWHKPGFRFRELFGPMLQMLAVCGPGGKTTSEIANAFELGPFEEQDLETFLSVLQVLDIGGPRLTRVCHFHVAGEPRLVWQRAFWPRWKAKHYRKAAEWVADRVSDLGSNPSIFDEEVLMRDGRKLVFTRRALIFGMRGQLLHRERGSAIEGAVLPWWPVAS